VRAGFSGDAHKAVSLLRAGNVAASALLLFGHSLLQLSLLQHHVWLRETGL